MKKCKKCGKDFTPQKGLKSYCSLKCRNSRPMTIEKREKISDGVKKYIKKNKKINFNTDEIYKKISKTRKENEKKKLLNEDFDNLSFERLRKRVMIEQKYKCKKCGISHWFDKKISLELDHIDGNNKNNKRENLEALCPNCHSITPTWRGRNKKQKKKITDKEMLKSLIKHEWNMRQSLLYLGLSAKGGNYKRCHKLKKEYEETL